LDLRTSGDAATVAILELLAGNQKLMDEKNSDPLARIVGPSLALARNRINALMRVLKQPSDTEPVAMLVSEMIAYLELVKESGEAEDLSDPMIDSGGGALYKAKAPIEQYLNLKNLHFMQESQQEAILCASTKRDLEESKSEVKAHRDAIHDLISACQKSLKDIGKAVSGHRRSQGSNTKSQSESNTGTTSKLTIHDFGPDIALNVTQAPDPLNTHMKSFLKKDEPFIISNVKFSKDLVPLSHTLGIGLTMACS
jgi:hypothetical protein